MTDLLAQAGDQVLQVDGEELSCKAQAARLIWTGAATGKVQFPDGREVHLHGREWLDLVKFLHAQIDGPPPAALKIGGDEDNPLETVVMSIEQWKARAQERLEGAEKALAELEEG